MIEISPAQMQVFDRAQRADFRKRAFAYVRTRGAAAPDAPDEALMPPFDYTEKVAADCGLDAERSRLTLFVLALTRGPGAFQDGALMGILHDRDVAERVRIRLAVDHVGARERAA